MNILLENQPLLADRAKTRERLESAEPDTLRLRKILVPLDLSECSRHALRFAGALARLKSDLLVMGTHEYSWWRRLREGGSTERLVRHAPCAVVSLRPKHSIQTSIDHKNLC